MRPELKPGLKFAQELRVDESLTVPAVSNAFSGFADMPSVFATAFMVGLIEWAAIEAIRPHLEDGEGSVGTHIDVSHISATPIGMCVTAYVELLSVEGRRLKFKVSCRDERDLIGEGTHNRVVIDRAKFNARLHTKKLGAIDS